MTIYPEHAHRQIPAIEIRLATAPDIQEDLKAKFGHGENIFFYLDLLEYRMNHSCEDIAEDLDLEERYDLINDQPRDSVGSAFRGYNGKDFPDHKFKGLLDKVTNDYIEGIRKKKTGLENWKIGDGIYGRTPEKHFEDSRKGGLAKRGRGFWQTHPELLEEICELKYGEGLTWKDTTNEFNRRHGTNYNSNALKLAYHGLETADMINPETGERYVVEAGRKGGLKAMSLLSDEERSEHSRKGNEAQGKHVWSLEEIVDIHNFREESIGKGRYKTQPSWDYVIAEMNEKYDKDWSTIQVKKAYYNNKDLPSDEEE